MATNNKKVIIMTESGVTGQPDLETLIDNLSKQTMEDTRSYINSLKEIIKKINESEPIDRLDYAKTLNICFNGAIISLNGWKTWIGNIDNLAELSLDDLKEIYPKLKELIVKLLEIDIAITEKKLVETAVKITKSKPRTKNKSEKSTYVA